MELENGKAVVTSSLLQLANDFKSDYNSILVIGQIKRKEVWMKQLILILICLGLQVYAQPQQDWLTYYEKSNYLETPRYSETLEYCQRLDEVSPWIKYTSFGVSPQGRELPLVIVDKNGNFSPEQVKNSGNAILLIQSGIHAGEIDGKDASLMLMREIAITKTLAPLIDNVTILFIPIFNVDGHERFGPYNRINQNGPKGMGWRTTAQNYNLNRDFMKADAPEMQAWLELFNRWLPDLLVDCHVTDGADYQYVVTYGVAKDRSVSSPLREWSAEVFESYLNEKMDRDGFPMFPYIWFKERPDIEKGLISFIGSPRYSTSYGAVQNRIFFLIETHMLKDYKTRVTAAYHLLKHIIELCNTQSATLRQVNQAADRQTKTLAGQMFPISFRPNMQDSAMVDFLGIEYEIVKSDISGGDWVRYGDKPATMKVSLFDKSIPTDSVKLPYAYLIPKEWQVQIERLKLHGVEIKRLQRDTVLAVESYRFNNIRLQNRSFEGRQMVNADVELISEERYYPAGTAVALLNQRTNRVIAHLLEPNAPDSFLKWGFWNTIFERKEYAEDYVLEELAREMLKDNPQLKEEFEQRIATDEQFANNHWNRLYFFYEKTPYWDEKLNVYPVGRLMEEVNLPLQQ